MTIELSECREHHTSGKWKDSSGKQKMAVQCPYCDSITNVFISSFVAAGKKCKCGVLHASNGFSYKKTKAVKRGQQRKRVIESKNKKAG